MKKTLMSFLAVGVIGGGVGGLPEAPIVTIDTIAPLSYEAAQFPATYNVTGAADYGTSTTSASVVNLYVNDVLENSQNLADGSTGVVPYSVPWSIPAAGTYTLKVTANNGPLEGIAEQVVVVEQAASAPVVTLTLPASLTYDAAQFPASYTVPGTVDYGAGVIPALGSTITLYVNNSAVSSSPVIVDSGTGTVNYSFPWSIPAAATYAMKVVATNGPLSGSAEQALVVEQTVVVPPTDDDKGCHKAAPAIANELLREKGVRHKADTDKSFISYVARKMGERTDFDGVDVRDRDHYRAAVDSYLRNVVHAY